jgi:hypothetical protein
MKRRGEWQGVTEPLNLAGFWSYTSSDDTASHGRLSQLRRLLAAELQLKVGGTPKVHIFQDVAAIPLSHFIGTEGSSLATAGCCCSSERAGSSWLHRTDASREVRAECTRHARCRAMSILPLRRHWVPQQGNWSMPGQAINPSCLISSRYALYRRSTKGIICP